MFMHYYNEIIFTDSRLRYPQRISPTGIQH